MKGALAILRDPRTLGAVVAGWAGWTFYGLMRPGAGVTSLVQDVTMQLGGKVQLSADQRAMVDTIEREASAAGLAWLAVAAVANAWCESALNPLAAGDGGHSIGLFQLHDRGAGAGMSREAREDPAVNARRIFEVVNSADGANVRAARGKANNAELSALFAQWVERCAACGWSAGSGELTRRRDTVTSLFGAAVAAEVPR